jgi:cell wall-associated NlpC family hydrolase
LGVPYHKRYHNEDSPHFNAPLYLDCCGLVRKALRDMAPELGFTVGPWNQSYQYDTLPDPIAFEDMKPGDLIFYAGTYYNARSRPQKHDIVHVEMYMGSGERSIGARWWTGVVQVRTSPPPLRIPNILLSH